MKYLVLIASVLFASSANAQTVRAQDMGNYTLVTGQGQRAVILPGGIVRSSDPQLNGTIINNTYRPYNPAPQQPVNIITTYQKKR